MKKLNYFLFLSMFAMIFVACEDDDDDNPGTVTPPLIENEEEVITNFTLTMTPDSGDVAIFNFVDLDGDGGMNPILTFDTLMANTTYSAAITLFNSLESPPENITLEVAEEDDEHQFFFSTDVSGLSVDYMDMDGDGNPIGLLTNMTTTSAASGNLQIILRHEPNKDAAGVSDGDITNAGGETDIEVNFDILVQ